MRENHLAILIPLLSIAATGCREPCSDDEVRYGDRCVLRPDGGTLHDEDASAADEDGGEWEDEMDAWTATPEEDGSVPSPDNPDDDDDPHDADAGVEDSGTEPPICPDAPGCHRKVVHFTYGAPGCAILDDGTLWCWGGVDGPRLPRQVGQDAEWQAVSSSDNSNDEFGSDRPGNHTCGINGGAMYCWGDNYAGQLGLGSSEDHAVPAPRLVGEAKDWTAVSAAAMPIIGGISCGIRAGALYCWGGTPTRIGSRDDWTSVSAGPVMTCGIAGGTARCWNPNQQITETSILPWTDWQMISSGDTHACGIRGGKAYCWGQNGYGQLGLGTTGTVTSPAQVGSEEDWTFIDTSFSQTCAIRAGALYCWGALSLRTITDEPSMASLTLSPRRIGADSDWATVNVGTQGGCARRTNGQLLCWGSNDYGELGTKRVPTRWIEEPTRVGEADNWLKVATGSTSTCGLRGGELYCWGTLYERRERSTAILASSKPMRVGSASDWTTVAMHFDADHVCGVRNDGLSPSRIWCWGDASVGQLGPEATTSSSSEPVLAGHTGPWLEVAVGAGTSCGQTVSEIVCWGDSWAGPTSVEPNRTLQGTKWGDFGTTMGIHDGRLLDGQAQPLQPTAPLRRMAAGRRLHAASTTSAASGMLNSIAGGTTHEDSSALALVR